MPAPFLQYPQDFCEETDLLLLADVLDEILMENEIDTVAGDRPGHVGIAKLRGSVQCPVGIS